MSYRDKLIRVAAHEARQIERVCHNNKKLQLFGPDYNYMKSTFRYVYSQLREAMRPEPQFATARYVWARHIGLID